MIQRAIGILSLVLLLAAVGCVERKMTVTSTPPGARVYLDDQEMGQTPVTFRFDFCGHRTFVLKKDGYRVAQEVRNVRAPVYDWPPLDVFADLGPIPLKDHRTFHFDLRPVTEVKTDELIERAKAMKSRLEGGVPPGKAPASETPKGAEGGKKPTETAPPSETKPEPVQTPPEEPKPDAPAPAR